MRQRAPAATRAVVAVATSAAISFSLGGLVLATAADAAVPYVAISPVNVRSGPGTSHKVIGMLAVGRSISGSSTASGWVKVSFQGGTGYVWGDYLTKTATATTSPTPAPSTTTGKAATKVTTADLNVRTGPGLDSPIVRVLPKGSMVSTTGTMSERWAEVTIGGTNYWMSSSYLADPSSTSPSLPAVAYTATTTAELAMRRTPEIGASSAGTLKAGSTVSLTGTHSGSYSQIVRKDIVVWVLTGYLRTHAGPNVPTLPKSAGKRYVSVDEVNIRATSASDGKVVDTVTQGTVLLITGKTANKRSEVIFGGALRWAYSAYLSTTRPNSSPTPPAPSDDLGSATLNRTNAYAHVVVKKIRARFPQIKTIYGWRMSSAYSSDHPAGRALDIMIPSYKSAGGKALGDSIARYLQDNHKALHVHYLIWRQRQWNVERNTNVTTGWRRMSDRGSDTDNHLNHVHVTVYDVK